MFPHSRLVRTSLPNDGIWREEGKVSGKTLHGRTHERLRHSQSQCPGFVQLTVCHRPQEGTQHKTYRIARVTGVYHWHWHGSQKAVILIQFSREPTQPLSRHYRYRTVKKKKTQQKKKLWRGKIMPLKTLYFFSLFKNMCFINTFNKRWSVSRVNPKPFIFKSCLLVSKSYCLHKNCFWRCVTWRTLFSSVATVKACRTEYHFIRLHLSLSPSGLPTEINQNSLQWVPVKINLFPSAIKTRLDVSFSMCVHTHTRPRTQTQTHQPILESQWPPLGSCSGQPSGTAPSPPGSPACSPALLHRPWQAPQGPLAPSAEL